jgi:hypothetical protein
LIARAGIVLELFLRRVSSWLNYRMAIHLKLRTSFNPS